MSDEGERTDSDSGSQAGKGSFTDQVARLQQLLDASKLSAEVPENENPCDEKIQDEKSSFEADRQQAELDKLTAEIESLKQDTKQRKGYAGRIFWLNVAWIAILTLVVLLSGFQGTRFVLPTSVLLALVGTTTLNILGTLYIVAQYLFPKKH
jgi:hypothetical protein